MLVTENRNGLVVDTRLTLAGGMAEPDAAAAMMECKPTGKRVILGKDRGNDTVALVEKLRSLEVTRYIAQNTTNRQAPQIDARRGTNAMR